MFEVRPNDDPCQRWSDTMEDYKKDGGIMFVVVPSRERRLPPASLVRKLQVTSKSDAFINGGPTAKDTLSLWPSVKRQVTSESESFVDCGPTAKDIWPSVKRQVTFQKVKPKRKRSVSALKGQILQILAADLPPIIKRRVNE